MSWYEGIEGFRGDTGTLGNDPKSRHAWKKVIPPSLMFDALPLGPAEVVSIRHGENGGPIRKKKKDKKK